MFLVLLLLNVLLCYAKVSIPEESDGDFGTNLVAYMRNDANLDLSADEEYEDLRAELLAYHTALASLSSGRRSLKSTPCWTLGGICVDHKLCTGFRYLTEVPGCKDKKMVCCFAWNKFKVDDWRHKGIGLVAMPWSLHSEFGGLGVIEKDKKELKKKKKDKKNKKNKKNKKDKKDKNVQLNDFINNAEDNKEESKEKQNDNVEMADAIKHDVEINNDNQGEMEINLEKLENEEKEIMELKGEKNDDVEVEKNENDDHQSVGRNRLANKKKTIALVLRANK